MWTKEKVELHVKTKTIHHDKITYSILDISRIFNRENRDVYLSVCLHTHLFMCITYKCARLPIILNILASYLSSTKTTSEIISSRGAGLLGYFSCF